MVSFGAAGALLDALPQLRKVADATTALLQSPTGADRRLAISLFEEFLAVLTQAVAADLTKAKTSAASVLSSLRTLEESRKRIVLAATSESVRFSGLDSSAITSLLDALLHDAAEPTMIDLSLDHAAQVLDDVGQSFEAVENALVKLDSAYCRVTHWIKEHSTWISPQSSP